MVLPETFAYGADTRVCQEHFGVGGSSFLLLQVLRNPVLYRLAKGWRAPPAGWKGKCMRGILQIISAAAFPYQSLGLFAGVAGFPWSSGPGTTDNERAEMKCHPEVAKTRVLVGAKPCCGLKIVIFLRVTLIGEWGGFLRFLCHRA